MEYTDVMNIQRVADMVDDLTVAAKIEVKRETNGVSGVTEDERNFYNDVMAKVLDDREMTTAYNGILEVEFDIN